jgi:D-alanine-D-alanine ligase
VRIALLYSDRYIKKVDSDLYNKFRIRDGALGPIARALRSAGHSITRLDTDNINFIQSLKKISPDITFNLATGKESVQEHIPALLEMLGIPYTGPSSVVHGIALDKSLTKKLLVYEGLQTPEFQVFRSENDKLELRFPLIVKPLSEGSSRGIQTDSLVLNRQQLKKAVRHVLREFRQPALIEEFIDGRELTVGLIGNKKPLMLTMEIILPAIKNKFRFFTYELKEQIAYTTARLADLPRAQQRQLHRTAMLAYSAVGCCDFARVDLILAAKPYVLEVNSLPGLYQHYSAMPALAELAGMSYQQLINKILLAAARRHGLELS